MIEVTPTGQACGAIVEGVDFSQAVDGKTLDAVRSAWLEHHVLAFPRQQLSNLDLENFARYLGTFNDEPFFVPMDGSAHVVALTRRADEKAPVFAEVWHSDWSFMAQPPMGTCLYSLVIPPVGGNTGFINQQRALVEMPAALRKRIEGRNALHSAVAAYAPDGLYGEQEKDSDRSMTILYSESARDIYPHPFINRHPESGRETLLGCLGYIVGIEGVDDAEALEILLELHEWQTRPEFQYTHKWQEQMLVLWDNRSVLHKANGGYDGYDRELRRITVAQDPHKFHIPAVG